MVVSMLFYYLLMITFQLSAVSGQTFSFTQQATGPSRVCEGSTVTLYCVIVLNNPDNITTVQSSVWSRNFNGMVTTISTHTPLPNHTPMYNSTNGAFTDLVITNVTLEDDNTVYTCSTTGATITSTVVLNVTGIPAVENLMTVDDCISVTVSWDITDEVSCKDLSYNVSLTSRDDGVTLQSITTDATSHTFTGVETSNELFSVSVNASNENARGPSRTATTDVRVSQDDLPSPVGLKTVSRICVTFFNISWNASNRITCGDVSYEVSVFQSSIRQRMVPFTRIGDIFHSSITGLNISDPDVMVTVTASNRAGQGNITISEHLPPSLDPPPINDVTASINRTPSDLSGFNIFIMWTRPVIDDPCATLPVSLYRINTSVTFMNGNQANYVSNNIMDTSGDSMGRFNVSYNDSFDEELVPNAAYNFTVNSYNVQIPPPPRPKTMASDDESGTSDINIIIGCIVLVLFVFAEVAAAYLYVDTREESNSSTATVVLKWVLIIFLITPFGIGCIFVAMWLCLWKCKKAWRNIPVEEICMWVFFAATLGLGVIFFGIYLCFCKKKEKDVQPVNIEMTEDKPSDVHDSTNKQEDAQKSAAQEQSLYSYARTGPINVVVPGGKP